jgi:hypothetical protein
MDIADEMMSDPPSDDPDDARGPEVYPDITQEQRAQMESGFTHIRSLLGRDLASDREIREALWDSYFDVEGTVQWFLDRREEEEKARRAKEKQKGMVYDSLLFVVRLSMHLFCETPLLSCCQPGRIPLCPELHMPRMR